MTGPWWTGVPATQATLACGEERHRLAWRDGELLALDHADVEGERALAVLGGEPIPCIALLDTWHRHRTDVDVLLLSSRGPADLVAVPEEMPPHMKQQLSRARQPPRRGGWVGAFGSAQSVGVGSSRAPQPASDHSQEQDLARLLSLGGALGRRFETTVAAHWQERLLDPDDETARLTPRLHAALYGRLLTTLGGWLDESELVLELELQPARESGAGSLRRLPDGGIHASLPFGWLVEVWGRGLEVIWGRFCLAASSADGHRWQLITLDPGLHEPRLVTVDLPA